MKREKVLESMLVIATGFLVLFLVYEKLIFLYIAVSIGFIGIFLKSLSKLLAKGWFYLGDVLGFIVSKIVLAIIFFLLIVPISFLYNIFNRDTLKLKNNSITMWVERNHVFKVNDLKNTW